MLCSLYTVYIGFECMIQYVTSPPLYSFKAGEQFPSVGSEGQDGLS